MGLTVGTVVQRISEAKDRWLTDPDFPVPREVFSRLDQGTVPYAADTGKYLQQKVGVVKEEAFKKLDRDKELLLSAAGGNTNQEFADLKNALKNVNQEAARGARFWTRSTYGMMAVAAGCVVGALAIIAFNLPVLTGVAELAGKALTFVGLASAAGALGCLGASRSHQGRQTLSNQQWIVADQWEKQLADGPVQNKASEAA